MGFIYLQHVDGATFKGGANLDLSHKLWVLCHQQVHEFIDLRSEEERGLMASANTGVSDP